MALFEEKTKWAARVAILGFSALAAGCVAGGGVYEISPAPIYSGPAPQRPQVCTREYAPVCGVSRGERRTFGNACEAESSGYRVAHGGQCGQGGNQAGPRPGGGWDRPGRPDRPGWGSSRPPQSDRMCTQEYQPVCARRGDHQRTFGNSCSAETQGYRVVGRGQC